MARWFMPEFIRLSTLLRRESRYEDEASRLWRLSNAWLNDGNAWGVCDGWRADCGVSGMEFREGESSALRMVWSWRPVVLETPDECLLWVWEMDQVPESRASGGWRACIWDGSGEVRLCVSDAMEGRA